MLETIRIVGCCGDMVLLVGLGLVSLVYFQA